MKKILIPSALLLALAACTNPVLAPMDRFVNQTYCPIAVDAIAKDSTIAPELKNALNTELKAMRRLLDVTLDRDADSEVEK